MTIEFKRARVEHPHILTTVSTQIPTCLTSLGTRDLTNLACVNKTFYPIAKKCVIHISHMAADLFEKFRTQNENQSFICFKKYKTMISQCNYQNIAQIQHIGNIFKKSVLALEFNRDELQQFQKMFLGQRLPLGLEDLFKKIANQSFEKTNNTLQITIQDITNAIHVNIHDFNFLSSPTFATLHAQFENARVQACLAATDVDDSDEVFSARKEVLAALLKVAAAVNSLGKEIALDTDLEFSLSACETTMKAFEETVKTLECKEQIQIKNDETTAELVEQAALSKRIQFEELLS